MHSLWCPKNGLSATTRELCSDRPKRFRDVDCCQIAKALIERWPLRLGPCDSGRTEVTIAFNLSFHRAATNRRSEIFSLQIPQTGIDLARLNSSALYGVHE